MRPREAATATASDDTPFVVDNIMTRVSSATVLCVSIAVATPEINNLHAVAVDGDGGSDLLAAGHIAAENVD